MNKLKNIIEESYIRIFNGDYDKDHKATVKETIKDACIEYAKNVTTGDLPLVDTLPYENMPEANYSGYAEYRDSVALRIDQDLLSLKEKNI